MSSIKLIAFLLAGILFLVLYPQQAEAVYQCSGGARNVTNGVCRTTIYDDKVRCPGNKPSTSCFGFAVSTDTETNGNIDATTHEQDRMAFANGDQAMPSNDVQIMRFSSVQINSPAIAIETVGKVVAPGILQISPESLNGRVLNFDNIQSYRGVCIGVFSTRKGKCTGIFIGTTRTF